MAHLIISFRPVRLDCPAWVHQDTPVDGAANAELLVLLSTVLGLPKSTLRLVLGEASKHKVVEVAGLADDEVARRLTIAAAR